MAVQFVKDDFVKKVVDQNPQPLTELGQFVFYRTYSRWLPAKGRREFWYETCQRAVNYNVELAYKHLKAIGFQPSVKELRREAEKLFLNMYETKQFLSGRTLWVGGAENSLAEKYPMSNYNCSFLNIEEWKDLGYLFYLLMIGTGVGFKVTKKMAEALPKVRNNFKLIHSEYDSLPKVMRLEHSKITVLDNGFAKIFVGDSKEGWVEALSLFLELITKEEYEHVHTIKINYNSVRPKGERLLTFGGTASGHTSLLQMFDGFDKVLKNEVDSSLEPLQVVQAGYSKNAVQIEGYEPVYVKIRPIHIMDMGNLIGANVVIGGVRRTAEIYLFDDDDSESLLAKYGINGFWTEKHFTQHEKVRDLLVKNNFDIPQWFDEIGTRRYVVFYNKTEKQFFDTKEEAEQFAEQHQNEEPFVSFPANEGRKGINHRRMSNNSVAFEKKPSREQHELQFALLQGEGEPCFINLEEAKRRRPNAEGLNPCAEILLDSKALCNLTTINVVGFVSHDGNGGFVLDIEGLLEAQRISTKAGIRMTLVTLELEDFDKTQKRDRLIGTSMTGWKDAMSILGYTKDQEDSLLELLGNTSRHEADKYALKMRIASPLLATTVKPEGTLSQVARNPITNSPVSSGLHMSHSPFFIRRIRINSHDPLAKVAIALGWTVNPEVGTEGATFEERMQNATTLVIDFPVASGATITKNDITVKMQFDTYFQFQEKYTEHNSSNTISVKDGEWEEAEQIVWDKWDDFVGVSFLSHDGGTYQLAPYEEITEEQYHELRANMKGFDPQILQAYEQVETEFDIGDDACLTGICPVR